MTIATNIHVHQLKYDNHLILGFVLDSPKSNLVAFSNTINVCGWVLGKKMPAVAVEMVKEQQIVAQSHVNIHRPKVAEYYPDISNYQSSGFEFELDLKKNLLGSQNFCLQVVLENHTRVPVVMLDVNHYEHKSVKKTFFIHVAKTAGTSFNHFLRTHLCGEEHCENYKNRDSFHNLNKLKTFDFISGHLRLQDFNQNFDRKDYYLVTILMDPIEQLISHLNWVIYISNDVESEFFKNHPQEIRKMSLDIRHKNLHNTEDIIQVLCDYRGIFANNQSRYFQLNQDLKPAEIIDILRDFDLVGITENYFQFISDYINLVGLNINPEIHMENKNVMPAISKNELLSNSEFVEFCHEYNSVDIQVYNYYSKKKDKLITNSSFSSLITNQPITLDIKADNLHKLKSLTINGIPKMEKIERMENRLSQIKKELTAMSSFNSSTLDLANVKGIDQDDQLSQEIIAIAVHSQACISQMKMVLAESQNQLYRTEAILEKNQEKLFQTRISLKENQDKLWRVKIQVKQLMDQFDTLKPTSNREKEIVASIQYIVYQLWKIVSARSIPIRRVYIRGCPRSGNTLMLLLCGVGFKNSHVLTAQDIPIPNKSNPNQITFGTFPSPEGLSHKKVQADHFLDLEDAAIIFMIRDPRDVLVSEHGAKPGEPWIKDPKRWIDNALILNKVKEHERVLWIKYEDLVTNPNAIQEKIAVKFGFDINKPFSECWQHFQPISPDYLKSIKEIKPLEKDKIGVWNKDPKKKDYVTQKLAQRPEIYDLMKEFGYLPQDNHNLKPMIQLNQRPQIKPPLLANGAVEFLQQFLQQNPHARVLEFGSGGSTVWFSTYTKNVVSIEHNREWYDRVKRDLDNYDNCNPVDLRLVSLPYYGVCEDFQDESFDLILVDGRNRVRCAQTAIRILKTGGILMLDDAQRPYYHRVHHLLQNWEYNRRIHPQRQTDWWVKPPNFKSTDSDWARIFKQSPIRLYAGSLSPKAKQDGWIGLAHNRSDQWHIKHDLTKLMPIPDEVVDCFQAEDVIEHIEPSDLLAVTFPEIYRVMKSGGFIRISVPDYRCDYLINRCWKNDEGEPYYDPQGGGKWDAKRKRVTPRGHVWLPTYERLRSLIELSPLRNCQANWLHYYDTNGQPVMHDIDYSKGYVMRTPDHDNRVKTPRRPLSIVVDLYKD